MENPQIIDENFGGSTLNSEIKAYLAETARWGYFLSIIGFIGIGFIVLIGLFFVGFMSTLMADIPFFSPILVSSSFLIGAALYFFPTLYLYRFSAKMKIALRTDDEAELTTAFQNLKSLYKFFGVLTAIYLSFVALSWVFMAVAGVMM